MTPAAAPPNERGATLTRGGSTPARGGPTPVRGEVSNHERAEAPHAFFTIGHSTRTVEELVALLRAGNVEVVVDVRTIPRSRTNPQFNLDAMPAALAPHGLDYLHMAGLGGLRGKRRDGPSPNTFWTNTSFRNYADHALTPAFGEALAQLRELGHWRACAVMCSEAVWWRCHRRLIADYLLAAGERVFHIMDRGKLDPAQMTESAVPQPDGTLLYP